ncbi:MAG TPA: 3-oxoacyl-[acyl-carrier-protein] synthase III C-terminal domain-containing protein [Actinomycetes bacterium]|nr:3-oxoacyl-[acyl-carrier-protein] synthase III C-terminal domain-containing protein [Actinomycetes bacterium]
MSVVAGVGTALGAHSYPQAEITDAFVHYVLGADGEPRTAAALRRFHDNSGVQTRHLALPLAAYPGLDGFTGANAAWREVAVGMGAGCAREALSRAGLVAADVDLVVSTTVTGVVVPSLDALLVPVLGLRDDVKRVPLFGLGCVAGAAGIARIHDYLSGHPDGVALLIAVELCSLTVQRDDTSMANLVASGLFGDGAAAVVLVGERRARALGLTGPAVLASRSRFYEDTEAVMGWDVGGSGFKVVLAPTVADVVRTHLGTDVKGFLADEGLEVHQLVRYIAHPGGPKVIDAVTEALGLAPDALAVTRTSLRQKGNLSSASVLHVLRDALDASPPGSGEPALLMAMGPGFCAELVLLQW